MLDWVLIYLSIYLNTNFAANFVATTDTEVNWVYDVSAR